MERPDGKNRLDVLLLLPSPPLPAFPPLSISPVSTAAIARTLSLRDGQFVRTTIQIQIRSCAEEEEEKREREKVRERGPFLLPCSLLFTV